MKEINEVFIPLNSRLAEFETSDFPSSISAEEYIRILAPIKANMGLLDHDRMLNKARLFNGRVLELLIHLSIREKGFKKKTNWRSELSYYLTTLDKIQEHLIQFSKNEKAFNPETELADIVIPPLKVVDLPENFSVKQFGGVFTPKLSPNQTVLLLSLLREEGILPPYTDSSLGKLGEAFFARNQKTITKGLTDIYSLKKNKEDITVLKSLLQEMLNKL